MTIATRLLEAFSVLPDPRLARGKEHRWSELLFIAICTLLTGGESFYDMEEFVALREEWLCTFLELPGGPPSHDTFNRLFQALDPAAFAETFAIWTEGLRAALPKSEREIVAVDGKAARYLVSAWATENGLTLGQVQVADKSNEITAVTALLRLGVDGLRGHRRRAALPEAHGQGIKEADADYVLALKSNQGTAHQEIKDALDDAIAQADPKLATL